MKYSVRKTERSRGARFLRSRRGSTTVELALVLMPFLMLAIGSLELGIVHMTRSSLAHSVSESYRPIYTGAQQCATVDSMKQLLCSNISMISPQTCNDNIRITMETLATFDAEPAEVDDFDTMQENVESGSGGEIMLMRVFYRYEFMAPLMASALGGANGSLLLAENIVFRTEPFAGSGACS